MKIARERTADRRGARARRAALAPAALVGAVALLSGAALATDEQLTDVSDTRAALEKYVEAQRTISAEKADWAVGRDLLVDRVEVIQREIESLRAKIDKTRADIADADTKRAELVAENDRLKEAGATYGAILLALEGRTQELLPRLPDPIRERVKPLSQRIPEVPDETKLGLAERYGNVVGILNEINRFHREVSVNSEVRTLSNGTTAEVTALYVGISQGYYVDGGGQAAGIGTGTGAGWTWSPADEAAAPIARAIAIFQSEEIADFVQLPVRID